MRCAVESTAMGLSGAEMWEVCVSYFIGEVMSNGKVTVN